MGGRLSGVFRCGAYFLYRCVLNADGCEDVCSIEQFERDAPPPRRLPQCSKREAVRLLSHRNVLCLAAWPRRGVLAYERGDGVSAESDFWWRYRGRVRQGASRRLRPLCRARRRHCEVAGGDGLVYAPPVAHIRGVRHLINGVDNASIQKSAVPALAIDRHKCLVIMLTYLFRGL